MGAGVVGWAGRRRPELHSVVVVSDATAHQLWVQPGVGRYVAFSQIAAGSVRQYDPYANVAVIDPPVRPQFRDAPDRLQARRALGWPDAAKIVLLMGGGWGRGPLLAVADRLVGRDLLPVVLAGANQRLLKNVATDRQGARQPVVLGPQDDVARLMAAADVVVTSPGQACHEARAVGRPLVVMDTVPGHGRENLLGELSQGGALASPPRPNDVAAAVLAALDGVAGVPERVGRVEWSKQLFDAVNLPA
jgi:UDP-N-acetylglucosamine:LPS N-acetylglucosamine transferase